MLPKNVTQQRAKIMNAKPVPSSEHHAHARMSASVTTMPAMVYFK